MKATTVGQSNIITQACDFLVKDSDTLPEKTLRTWQSTPLTDSTGAVSYVRYGVKKINAYHLTPALCVDTFKTFALQPVGVCGNLDGFTKGAEFNIGGSVVFSADPNQVNTNS